MTTFKSLFVPTLFTIGLLVASPILPAHAADETSLSTEEQLLDRMEQELMAELTKLPGDQAEARKVIEKSVRDLFEQRLKLQETRLAKAEENLKRIREMLKQRRASADSIVATRVAELLDKTEVKADSSDDASMPASVLASEGWEAWRKRDYRESLTKFRSALKKEPKNGIALNGLGWTLIHLQDYDEAIKTFKTLLEQEPNHGAAMNGVGQALLVQGKFDEAEATLKKTTEEMIGQYGEAKAAKMGLASWHGLIRVYTATKDYASATKWCNRYLEHDPENKDIKTMLDEINELEKAE